MTRKALIGAFALIALGLAFIGTARWRVASWCAAVKDKSDVYSLPPAQLLRPVSLGYTSAFADLIWSHILVTQGLRTSERRPFEHLEHYLDAVNTLDPKFREPYRLADSLLAFQSNDPRPDHSARTARRILERGLREHPLDAQLWMNYGEFLAYVGSPALKDDKEKESWRIDGARALVRAGELGTSKQDQFLYWHAISAANILSKAGERDAMMRFLERVYTTTEDEELKRFLEHRIKLLEQGRRESRAMRFNTRFEELWRGTAPFASRTQRRVVGPTVSPWACSGQLSDEARDRCSRDWNAWARAFVDRAANDPGS